MDRGRPRAAGYTRARVPRLRGEALPDPRSVRAVVVTGSAAMVTSREPWSERTAAWLCETVEVKTPVLGICYGHQLLAHALGGRVEDNPQGRHIGTVDVTLTDAAETTRSSAASTRCCTCRCRTVSR